MTDPTNQTTYVPTTITVSRTVKIKNSPTTPADQAAGNDEPKALEVNKFATTPAQVTWAMDFKKSYDFSSVSVHVGVTIPCYAEEVAEAKLAARDFVVEALQVEVPKIVTLVHQLSQMRPAPQAPGQIK